MFSTKFKMFTRIIAAIIIALLISLGSVGTADAARTFNWWKKIGSSVQPISGSYGMTIPGIAPASTECLEIDSAGAITASGVACGVASSITVGTTTVLSGTDTRVPFNDGGTYEEDSGFEYDKALDKLMVDATFEAGLTGTSSGALTVLSAASGSVKVKASDSAVTTYTMELPQALTSTGAFMYDTDGSGTMAMTSDITINETTDTILIDTIPLSNDAATTFLVGDSSNSVTDFVMGNGAGSATPASIEFHPTAASGTNIAGAEASYNGGMSSGNAPGGDITFKTSPSGGSGSSINSLVEVGSFNSDGEFTATATLDTTSSATQKEIHTLEATLTNTGTVTGTDYFGSGAELTFDGTGSWTGEATNFNIMSASGGIATVSGSMTANSPITANGGIARQTGGSTLSGGLIGTSGIVVEAGAGSIASASGLYSNIYQLGGGSITNAIGVNASGITGSATNTIGVDVANYATGASSASYGVRIQAQSGTASNQYGLSIGNVTGGSSNYALQTGTGLVEFRDDVTISNTSDLTVSNDIEIDGDFNHDGSNIGFFGTAPAALTGAYTQTYANSTRTHNNMTSADLSLTSTNSSPWGFNSQAEADSIQTEVNALRADLDNVKQLLNQAIDDLQVYGLMQ